MVPMPKATRSVFAVDQESGPIDLSPQSRQEVRGIGLCLSNRAVVCVKFSKLIL